MPLPSMDEFYQVFVINDINKFNKRVNNLIRNGWKVLDRATVMHHYRERSDTNQRGDIVFSISMVRKVSDTATISNILDEDKYST